MHYFMLLGIKNLSPSLLHIIQWLSCKEDGMGREEWRNLANTVSARWLRLTLHWGSVFTVSPWKDITRWHLISQASLPNARTQSDREKTTRKSWWEVSTRCLMYQSGDGYPKRRQVWETITSRRSVWYGVLRQRKEARLKARETGMEPGLQLLVLP